MTGWDLMEALQDLEGSQLSKEIKLDTGNGCCEGEAWLWSMAVHEDRIVLLDHQE